MRTTLLAAFALLAFGASEGAASVADTSRAVPGFDRTAAEDLGPLQPPALMQAGASYQSGDRRQEQYGRYDQDYRPGVRVWMDGNRDLYRVGDRSRVLVRTDRDAYVAVLHIDTDGNVEVLFPSQPGDDGYLRGGRAYSVRPRGSQYVSMRGGYGIGYIFAVASNEPLDDRVIRDLHYRRVGSWDPNYNVYGDPFRAMDRYERMLVGDWGYGEHDSDYYTYHVGRRYTHPRYACYDSYGSWYGSRSVYYDSCDRVRVLLVQVPYYYDTRYYRGDRRVYYARGGYYGNNGYYGNGYYDDRYRRTQPSHGYKERTEVRDESRGYSRRPAPPASRGAGSYTQREGEPGQQQEPRVVRPERQRPTFERRSPDASPPSESRRPEPRSEPRTETRREPPPERRTETRREAPPARQPSSDNSPSRPSAPRVRPPSE
ncbi:MAG TPA: DUF4384 domain-containing protein [Longimicrobium sp.]|jgi:hypothetical protein